MPQGYPSDLSDVEWGAIEPLIPKPAQRALGLLTTNASSSTPSSTFLHRARRKLLAHAAPRRSGLAMGVWIAHRCELAQKGGQGLRRRETPEGRQTTPSRGYYRPRTGGEGSLCSDARPRGAKLLLGRCTGGFPRLELIWADQGYAGKLLKWVKSELGVGVQVVYAWWRQLARYMPESLERTRFKPKGFHGLPHRWVVEPTFAWLMFQRRLVRDYELLESRTENLVYVAMIRLMLKRLAF